MSHGQLGKAIDFVRRLAGACEASAPSDGQLLDAFVERRDEESFGELLRRHGPMVLAVCRRLLSDPNDAEDAFQATFLVLVRRAASIARPDQLAGWLHGVATRIAGKARQQRLRHPLVSLEHEPLVEELAMDE